MSLTLQLAVGVGVLMAGSFAFLWKMTSDYDRDAKRAAQGAEQQRAARG